MEYTEGEWKAKKLLPDKHGIVEQTAWEIDTEEYGVAVYIPYSAPIRKEADAQLISAAPELYEALKSIKSWLLEDGLIAENDLLNEHFIKANNLANKALSKAEGK